MNFAALFLALKTFLVANWLQLVIKAVPVIFPAVLFGAEWISDSVFGKVRLVLLLLSTCVLWLDLSGKLPIVPALAPTPTPTPTPTPKS
jgi:hypothetical protein